MEVLEKRLYYLELLHLYGDLLSDTQKSVLSDYLEYDLSISEIAINREISRAAVEDALKKAMAKLDKFEENMKLFSKKEKISRNIGILKEKYGESDEIKEIEEALL